MAGNRHARRNTLVPATPGRWVLTLLGLLSLASNAASHGQRYDHVISVLLALMLIAAGTATEHGRPSVRRVIGWVTGIFGVLAGVVAGTSLDEAMTLVAAAITAALISLTLPGSRPRARHATPRHATL
jgi:hypothetical protein